MDLQALREFDARQNELHPIIAIGGLPIGSRCKTETAIDFEDKKAPTLIVTDKSSGHVVVSEIYPNCKIEEGIEVIPSLRVCRV